MGNLFRRLTLSLPALFLTAQLGSANTVPAQSAEPPISPLGRELAACRALPIKEEADACELNVFDGELDRLGTASRQMRGDLDSAADVKDRAITLLTPDLSVDVERNRPQPKISLDEYNCC